MATVRPIPVSQAAIRAATSGDGPALFEHWQRARQHNSAMDRRVLHVPVSRDEFIADFTQMLQRRASVAFVAEVSGEIVGFVSGSLEANQPDRLPERHATIGYLYVAEGYRRGGIGRRLFEGVAEWAARQDGVSHFEMTVLAADEAAAAFWRSIGFTPFISRLWAPLSAPEPDA